MLHQSFYLVNWKFPSREVLRKRKEIRGRASLEQARDQGLRETSGSLGINLAETPRSRVEGFGT